MIRILTGKLKAFFVMIALALTRNGQGSPTVNDPRFELTLISTAPEIVTPIGVAIDKSGSVFVVESHTHFPPKDYVGPASDRVKRFDPANGNKVSVFAEGFHHAMKIAFGPDGRLYLAHRNGVIRLGDTNADGICDERSTILEMETPCTYPHNGLGGIAFSPDGWLYIGQGENMGEKYVLRGTDGSSHSGQGEGGNVYRCRPDGSHLELFATGFWNPFGMGFFGKNFLLAVDNDPDSRPPNRLLDVVQFGDYGFKFKYGRDGLHPYQAWNGELPGTLPMASGVGEAACSVLPGDQTAFPPEYRDAILVTAAWDHQIEVYHPEPFGASLRADRQVLVRGDENFRPVGMAAAPDGSVYFSDWVDVSYNVHGKGRLWRLAAKPEDNSGHLKPLLRERNRQRKRMERLMNADSVVMLPELIEALSDHDPFIRHAAIAALARPEFRDSAHKRLEDSAASVRLGALLALRRAGVDDAPDVVSRMLGDPDEQVRRIALVWAGEQEMISLTNRISAALSAGTASPTLLSTHAATARMLAKAAHSEAVPSARMGEVRVLRMSEPVAEQSYIATLQLRNAGMPLQARLDAVRHLAQTTNAHAISLLKRMADDRKENWGLRCEALLALEDGAMDNDLAIALLNDSAKEIQIEAARALRGHATDPPVNKALTRLAQDERRDPLVREQAQFALTGSIDSVGRPHTDAEWRVALAAKGDSNGGRRVFFTPAVGCGKCHRIEEFGGQIGPVLSTIAHGSDREKLMQSILHPSRDIAPKYVPHTVKTKDGQEFSGLVVDQSAADGITLFMANGNAALIPPNQIESDTQSTISLMPEGLEQTLTVQDFRDLLAFLLSRN